MTTRAARCQNNKNRRVIARGSRRFSEDRSRDVARPVRRRARQGVPALPGLWTDTQGLRRRPQS